jgi:hypothetical protein
MGTLHRLNQRLFQIGKVLVLESKLLSVADHLVSTISRHNESKKLVNVVRRL